MDTQSRTRAAGSMVIFIRTAVTVLRFVQANSVNPGHLYRQSNVCNHPGKGNRTSTVRGYQKASLGYWATLLDLLAVVFHLNFSDFSGEVDRGLKVGHPLEDEGFPLILELYRLP